jgi:hypothetical protein
LDGVGLLEGEGLLDGDGEWLGVAEAVTVGLTAAWVSTGVGVGVVTAFVPLLLHAGNASTRSARQAAPPSPSFRPRGMSVHSLGQSGPGSNTGGSEISGGSVDSRTARSWLW